MPVNQSRQPSVLSALGITQAGCTKARFAHKDAAMRISLRTSAASLTVAALLLPVVPNAFAQARPAANPTVASTAPSPSPTAPSTEDLATVREQLLALLRMSPTLSRVLESDPTLLADQDYISRSNPQLAQFLAQHPDITRNPDFFLFADLSTRDKRVDSLRRRGDSNQPPNGQEIHRQEMNEITMTLVFVGVIGSLLWLIRIFLENRRWSRIVRQQSEIHGKLIDRFASNQELFQYMETESGRRFLEAGPVPIALEREQRLPGGLARILGPLQFGIVLTLLGVGLLILQRSLPDIADGLLVCGTVALMPGLGFIISAIVTWRISARLGLMPHSAAAPADLSGRQ